MNYYNENDKHAAQWLRNLIEGGKLPPGDVDDRSIEDVEPTDLKGYTQCHFFAGIGGWSEALRLASWPTDRSVWTGSCPCQSFSAAGKGEGFKDPRHLWPAWFNLIKECRPNVIFGEQVDASIRYGWIDLVSNDLEKENYACGAIVLPACSVGAPNLRQRLWFMACCNGEGISQLYGGRQKPTRLNKTAGVSGLGGGHINRSRWNTSKLYDTAQEKQKITNCVKSASEDVELGSGASKLSNEGRECGGSEQEAREDNPLRITVPSTNGRWGTRGHWSDADWIYCRDELYRAVEPGTLPLATGVSNRVVKIRGYGNAIVPQVAAEVITAGMEYFE